MHALVIPLSVSCPYLSYCLHPWHCPVCMQRAAHTAFWVIQFQGPQECPHSNSGTTGNSCSFSWCLKAGAELTTSHQKCGACGSCCSASSFIKFCVMPLWQCTACRQQYISCWTRLLPNAEEIQNVIRMGFSRQFFTFLASQYKNFTSLITLNASPHF